MAHLGFDASKVEPMGHEAAKVWSKYQQRIFDFAEKETGNAIVEAVAGSGKSTTIVEAVNRVHGTVVFLAFNKSIADELKLKGVNARTFHSLCYGPVLNWCGTRRPEEHKTRIIMEENWEREDCVLYGNYAKRLIGLAKQSGIGCLVPDHRNLWVELADYHDIGFDADDERVDPDRALDLTRELFDLCCASKMIDFDDMLYYPVRFGISLPKFDVVFCDEAQDTNAIQRAILKMIMRRGSRLIAVGDKSQAIYGFRGADSDSLDLIANEFNCVKLPLSITYRCAESIVNYAKQWEPMIEARPDAPKGEVEDKGLNWHISEVTTKDLMVCRTTAPLIAVAFRMLKKRMPVRILGRDIGDGLKRIISKMKALTVDDLELKLVAFRNRESAKHMQRNEEKLAEALCDKVEALLVLCESLAEDEREVSRLYDVIDKIFSNRSDCTTLSTIHRAKGLEADRVFWVNSSQCPSPWAKKPWQKRQEYNLCYVAATRAKTTLCLVETA